MWKLIGKIVKLIFVKNKAVASFWAFGLILGFAGIFIYTTNTAEKSIRYDALVVWQNNAGGSWDIMYSIYSSGKNSWSDKIAFLDEGVSSRVGTLSSLDGDDQDPDVSSSRQKAVAVWSNRGFSGRVDSEIFYSFFDVNGGDYLWSAPQKIASLPGDDLDPAVYMADDYNALAVWINRGLTGESLYFSEYKDGAWSEAKKIPTQGNLKSITGPNLAFSDFNTRYILSFTAKENNKEKAFSGVYTNSTWSLVEIPSDFPAKVDTSVPNKFKTSLIMNISSELKMAYTGKDDSLWFYSLSKNDGKNKQAKRLASLSVSPTLLMDGKGTRVLYSEPADLAEFDENASNKIFVSKTERNYTRIDAVNFFSDINKKSIAVWSSKVNGEDDIAFSVYSSKWSKPAFIEKNYQGKDLAPAITPIVASMDKSGSVKKEQPFMITWSICGDGALNPGEECEIGIACKASGDVCDWDYFAKAVGKATAPFFAECLCYPLDDEIDGNEKDKGKEDEKDKDKEDGKNKGKNGFSDPSTPDFDIPNLYNYYSFYGAACGFDKITVTKSAILEEGEIDVRFSPSSVSGEEEKFSLLEGSSWSVSNETGTMNIFPKADKDKQPKAAVFIDFNKADISKATSLKMRGIDVSTGFQLCEGEFAKNDYSGEKGGLVPAPAN